MVWGGRRLGSKLKFCGWFPILGDICCICCGSCLICCGGGGGRMLDNWLLMREKERLSVSSSENRSRRFMSNLGCCLLVGCEK
jgi:hypothetical protein